MSLGLLGVGLKRGRAALPEQAAGRAVGAHGPGLLLRQAAVLRGRAALRHPVSPPLTFTLIHIPAHHLPQSCGLYTRQHASECAMCVGLPWAPRAPTHKLCRVLMYLRCLSRCLGTAAPRSFGPGPLGILANLCELVVHEVEAATERAEQRAQSEKLLAAMDLYQEAFLLVDTTVPHWRILHLNIMAANEIGARTLWEPRGVSARARASVAGRLECV